MYQKFEPPLRMTKHEAAERFSDKFIIMQMNSPKSVDDVGSVLYVGDNRKEIYAILVSLHMPFCGVFEGLDHRRNCLGGVVVSE